MKIIEIQENTRIITKGKIKYKKHAQWQQREHAAKKEINKIPKKEKKRKGKKSVEKRNKKGIPKGAQGNIKSDLLRS